MTPQQFCQSGTAERAKLAVHGVMLVGAGACAIYNIAACFLRKPERHLVMNSIVYAGLVILEWEHVKHHAASAS